MSSHNRIEYITRDQLGLQKKLPEEVLQISINMALNDDSELIDGSEAADE
jgi:hypothetical protein